jgi:hypothetical protein
VAQEAELNRVVLDWEVTDEVKVESYQVETSFDGRRFVKIGEVEATGNSFYSFVQERVSSGVVYYRLKVNDLNGQFAYSKIVSVNVKNGVDMFLYPNPSSGEMSIVLRPDLVNQVGTVRVSSLDGKELLRKSERQFHRIEVIDCSPFPSGRYLILIETPSGVFAQVAEIIR